MTTAAELRAETARRERKIQRSTTTAKPTRRASSLTSLTRRGFAAAVHKLQLVQLGVAL